MFDLYGHGPQNNIPSTNPQNYSNGHDRRRGPPKCRGISPSCGRNPHDHACCCDPCRHAHLNLCEGGCCRCVPASICCVFTPDSAGTNCNPRTWYARAEEIPVHGAHYTFSLPVGALSLYVGDSGYGTCVWRLEYEAMSIFEEVEIDHSGAVHCQAPPDFVITGINIPFTDAFGTTTDCFGTVTFTNAETQLVPFLRKWAGVAETTAVSCGACSEVCNILCVKRGNISDPDYTRVDFSYNTGTSRWTASDNSGDHFSLVESSGNCYLSFDDMPGVFNGDQILIDPYECAVGMNLYVEDYETGDWIRISCNKCSCWDFLCGECRCVCRDVCIVGADGITLVEDELSWGVDAMAWTDGVTTAAIQKSSSGGCEMTLTGFTDPVTIDSACGDDISAGFNRSLEDAEDLGAVKYRYVSCRNCSKCGAGTCLDACSNPPQVIYCDLEPSAWDAMLGCDDGDPCFFAVTFPMVLVYVSTLANPAGEWRWIGSVVIECVDCPFGPFIPLRKNFVVQVDLGCDGMLTFRVERSDSPSPLSATVSLGSIPCDDAAWEESFTIDGEGFPQGCCNFAQFLGTLSL